MPHRQPGIGLILDVATCGRSSCGAVILLVGGDRTQGTISRIERRSDLLLFTLRHIFRQWAANRYCVDVRLENLTILIDFVFYGLVQRGLSAVGKVVGLTSLGRVADKRYTLGITVIELHKAGIRLIDNTSGEASEHFAEFTDSEWRQLNNYLSHVADLHSTQFLIKGEGVQLNFAWNQGSNPQWRVKAPPIDDVLAFLHRLRPLILQEEPACFQKVRAVLKRRLKDAPIHPFMGWLLEVYEGKEMQKVISIQSNNCIVNSEKMLFTWLNAYEYHREREKQELLESYSKIMPTEWSRGVFLTLLVEKGKAISNLGALVEVVLGKRNALSLIL